MSSKKYRSLAVVVDSYYPEITSAALQMEQLVTALATQAQNLHVFVPRELQNRLVEVEKSNNKTIHYFKMVKPAGNKRIRRFFYEFLMPFRMAYRLHKMSLWPKKLDGVVFYSPSIFLSPLILLIKMRYGCKSFLILRDLFPDWLVDLGMLKKRLIFLFFKGFEYLQYIVSDFIGVQSDSDLLVIKRRIRFFNCETFVMPNWITIDNQFAFKKVVSQSSSAIREFKIVYAGNLGTSQNIQAIKTVIDVAQGHGITITFISRGDRLEELQSYVTQKEYKHIEFRSLMDFDKLVDFFQKCDLGLVTLDLRHTSGHVPGKFVSYVSCGLPVLCIAGRANNLGKIVTQNQLGDFIYDDSRKSIEQSVKKLSEKFVFCGLEEKMRHRARISNYAYNNFSTEGASLTVINSLFNKN